MASLEEKFLYHIWDAGHLLTPLKTASGKTVQVNYQGQFNTGRGPDFRNAVIDLGGQIMRGDVEIHINSYDWKAHEHHEDPYYNNVVLHVVMNAGMQTLTVKEDGAAVEIVELQNQLSDDIRKLLEQREPISLQARGGFCDLLSALDADSFQSTLGAWGLRRFQNKARRFSAALILSDFDQVLYEGIMEALGYEKNKHNLLYLAQAIPLKDIRAWQSEGLDALDLVAILSCSSGLLERCGSHPDERLRRLLQEAWERQPFFSRRIQIDWQLFRVRPQGHPLYRIFAMASLIHRTSGQGLMEYFQDKVLSGNAEPKKVFKAFSQAFAESVLPGSEKLPRPGQGLISNIYINIFLPISYMYGEKHSDLAAQERIIHYYKSFPALQENHITRFMNRWLSESQSRTVSKSTLLQQGLMELFHRYCRYHLCEECLADRP
ncbi:MAG: DUF2851 family protein [Candidatus Cloacimonadaceae bacterium]|jgi:hypothetical protein|nr:DUF2851 family protein [Candidatus Cloacimonadota bacterium]MDX9950198.1 DUF2851 family protein [Candidatus Syntrophosphaera sp.]NLN85565.1 DUF2851 family protein [Candidatus Cloacimonadota bacterium]